MSTSASTTAATETLPRSVPDAEATTVTQAAQAPDAAHAPGYAGSTPADARPPKKAFFARRGVRWGAAILAAVLLIGAGFAGGFATGAAVAGSGGPGSTSQMGPGQGGFPGGELPDGEMPQPPNGGQMPGGPGTGTDSGTGTGTDTGTGATS